MQSFFFIFLYYSRVVFYHVLDDIHISFCPFCRAKSLLGQWIPNKCTDTMRFRDTWRPSAGADDSSAPWASSKSLMWNRFSLRNHDLFVLGGHRQSPKCDQTPPKGLQIAGFPRCPFYSWYYIQPVYILLVFGHQTCEVNGQTSVAISKDAGHCIIIDEALDHFISSPFDNCCVKRIVAVKTCHQRRLWKLFQEGLNSWLVRQSSQ